MSEIFKFKQFDLSHKKSAQKMGTDASLLGALVSTTQKETKILDIGTGSGVIALMLAQRSEATIDAVEIDEPSFLEAKENFKCSPWAKHLFAIHSDLRSFNPNYQYDLIVSNPPFFKNSLKNPNKHRERARHSEHLPFEDLVAKVNALLSENGRFAVILPVVESNTLEKISNAYGLHLTKQIAIKSHPHTNIIRYISIFEHQNQDAVDKETVIIYLKDREFHPMYRELLFDYLPIFS